MASAFNISTPRDSGLRRDYIFTMLLRTSSGLPTIALAVVLLATGMPAWAQSCGTSMPAAQSAPNTNLPAAQPAPTTNLPAAQNAPVGGNTSLSSGLVSYWKLDDASGTSAADSVGSHTGTWSGTLGSQWTTGKINGGGNFNGFNNFINLGASNAWSFTSAMTLAAWIKTTNTHEQRVIVFQRTAGSTAFGLDIGDDASGSDVNDGKAGGRYRTTGSGAGLAKSNVVVSDGNWHFLVMIINATTGTFYIDGVSAASVSDVSDAGTFSLTTDLATIGSFTSGLFFLSGSIDEVGIWNRALSASEVATLYNAGNGDPFGNSSCGFSH